MTVRILRPGNNWPAGLDDLRDSPAQLWVQGSLLPTRPAVAVVGSRSATISGLSVATQIARDLVGHGIHVVSGLALGIDGAAHRGALEAGGTTTAVLGCDLEFDYPRQHHKLRHQIVASGALITEYPPGTEPAPHHYPRRNRLIAAMVDGLVVVEARARSGALSTARWAADLGREVLAVPGSIRSPQSLGTNLLIRDGCRPYLGIEDLLEAVYGVSEAAAGSARSPRPTSMEPIHFRILELVGTDGTHPDQIAAHLKLSSAELGAHLTTLELAGHLVTLAGGLVAIGPRSGCFVT